MRSLTNRLLSEHTYLYVATRLALLNEKHHSVRGICSTFLPSLRSMHLLSPSQSSGNIGATAKQDVSGFNLEIFKAQLRPRKDWQIKIESIYFL